jgi:hypothetical protein
LNENNPRHPQLADVCPSPKILRELSITTDRLRSAMQCLHEVFLLK